MQVTSSWVICLGLACINVLVIELEMHFSGKKLEILANWCKVGGWQITPVFWFSLSFVINFISPNGLSSLSIGIGFTCHNLSTK